MTLILQHSKISSLLTKSLRIPECCYTSNSCKKMAAVLSSETIDVSTGRVQLIMESRTIRLCLCIYRVECRSIIILYTPSRIDRYGGRSASAALSLGAPRPPTRERAPPRRSRPSTQLYCCRCHRKRTSLR